MKEILYTAIALMIASMANAQEQQHTDEVEQPQYVKYKLMIRPLELLVTNISITAERHYEKRSLGLTVAFKPATREQGEITGASGLFGSYRSGNMLNEAYNALTAGVNSKTYLHPQKKKNIYIDGQLLFRHWWFDNKDVSYRNVEGYRFAGTRTERVNVYNARILFGCSVVGRGTRKTKMVADFYGGLDMRYKSWQYITHDGTVMDLYHSYLKETGSYWVLTPYVGMMLGIGR